MKRFLVDLPDKQYDELTALVEDQQRPRALLMREAVAEYIVRHRTDTGDDAFGLWKTRQVDGVTYQETLRGEW